MTTDGMKRFKHLLCQFGKNYLWRVKDAQQSYWVVICTKCGYEKDMK